MFRRIVRPVNYFRKNYKNQISENQPIENSCMYYLEKYKDMSTYSYLTDEKIKELNIQLRVKRELDMDSSHEKIVKHKKLKKNIFSLLVGILFFITLLYEQRIIGLHSFYGKDGI